MPDLTSDFTVVIPTYNGEQRLPEVLACLRKQTAIGTINWEIVVVDNNSQDDTARVIQSCQAMFPCPLRYLKEPRQGLAYARQSGVQAAQSDWVGFIDDDNLPEPDWVSNAYQFAQSHPQAGGIASRIQGDFEEDPPAHYRRIFPFFALTDRGNHPLRYMSPKKLLPPGAGLVIRKQAWLAHVPDQPCLSGRIGQMMVAGEDIESVAHIQRAGWEIWYNPEMRMIHKIPARRLQRDYLIPMFQGIGLSRYITRMIGIPGWQRPFWLLAYLLNDLRKIISHLLYYRGQVVTDVIAASELTLYQSSFFSPFYFWRQRLQSVGSPPIPPEA
ncbi:MAG: hormogonium polysaccharide biosynthesis glycosyltransferase HpsE [Elainella sp. Prado103]|jgi:glycosyltransferase involved in cell wall biosynthesis|nr:hormogonium polysaccharide biosynthesis glycosyltransferase HpsE [Elainella sp. Prado103]